MSYLLSLNVIVALCTYLILLLLLIILIYILFLYFNKLIKLSVTK